MRTLALLLALLLLTGCTPAAAPDLEALRAEVMATERAFARTLADRDLAAFAGFLAEETVFFSGDRPVRGREAVTEEWRPYFDGPTPPFAWEPDQVEVLDSGTLAWSTGPVRDPDGNPIARFNSVWRREASGEWRIVFDRGSPLCPPPAAPAGP